MDGMNYGAQWRSDERPARRSSALATLLALLPLACAMLLHLALLFGPSPPVAEPVVDTSFMWGP